MELKSLFENALLLPHRPPTTSTVDGPDARAEHLGKLAQTIADARDASGGSGNVDIVKR